jgi:hypothetical protein
VSEVLLYCCADAWPLALESQIWLDVQTVAAVPGLLGLWVTPVIGIDLMDNLPIAAVAVCSYHQKKFSTEQVSLGEAGWKQRLLEPGCSKIPGLATFCFRHCLPPIEHSWS